MTDTLQFRDTLHTWARAFVPAGHTVERVRIFLEAAELPQFRVTIDYTNPHDPWAYPFMRDVFDDLTDPENLFELLYDGSALADDTDDD